MFALRAFALLLAALLHSSFAHPKGPHRRQVDLSAPQELPFIREYIHVGGHYADDGTGTGQQTFKEQMYVEQLTAIGGSSKPNPIVFIHGQAQRGTVSLLSRQHFLQGACSSYPLLQFSDFYLALIKLLH